MRAEGPSGSGWTVDFREIVLVSTDGTVKPIYTRQPSVSVTTTSSSGMSSLSAQVIHWGSPSPEGAPLYYHGDHLGSARLLSGYNGYPISSSIYLPYGEEFNPQTTVNHYKFTGKERDGETGLDNFGARYYGSNLGRFMTPDPTPYGIAIGDPQSWNLYSYVRNRPLNSVDLNGKWATELHIDMTGIALHGLVSAGELAHLMERQKVMDSRANQSPENSHKHAMRNGKSQASIKSAQSDIWGFVAGRMAQATSANGSFTSDQLDALGDAIHTVQDYTSPSHTDDSGNPESWYGMPPDGPFGLAYSHRIGEMGPENSWFRFGEAIRLTLAAYVQANPIRANQLGLDDGRYEAEANRRISDYVRQFFYYNRIGNAVAEDSARQCALGNPAACN